VAECSPAAPGLVLSPSQGRPAPAGSPVAYTVTVINNDSPVCGTRQFNLEDNLPTGWVGRLEASSLALAPGARASTTLTVTSPAGMPAGIYRLGIRVAGGPVATAAYVVQTGFTESRR